MAKVKILIKGYFKNISKTRCRAASTIVLIQDQGKNILFDTGNPQDQKKIVKALKKQGLKPKDIDLVVISHFHPDHVGCNYLFTKSRFIAYMVSFRGDAFDLTSRDQKLSKNLKLIATPGHSEDSVTLLVKTNQGIVACAGDLFWFEGDEKIEFVIKGCTDIRSFRKNRRRILKIADYIIPGHGGIYKVKKNPKP